MADRDPKAAATASASTGRKLAIATTVTTERGPVTHPAGTVPPKEHLEFITNPDVWEQDKPGVEG